MPRSVLSLTAGVVAVLADFARGDRRIEKPQSSRQVRKMTAQQRTGPSKNASGKMENRERL